MVGERSRREAGRGGGGGRSGVIGGGFRTGSPMVMTIRSTDDLGDNWTSCLVA